MSTRAMLTTVARDLGPLSSRVVFTGGATIAEYLDEPVVEAVRPTLDVDLVVEVGSRLAWYDIVAELERLGWGHPHLDGDHPICRLRSTSGVLVDVMPTQASVLGFANPWHARGFQRATCRAVSAGIEIHLFPPDVLLASKLEAFNGRGADDWYASHDIEDVMTVVEGRSSLVDDIRRAPDDVRSFVSEQLRRLRSQPAWEQIVEGHLFPSLVLAGRLDVTLARVDQLADLQ